MRLSDNNDDDDHHDHLINMFTYVYSVYVCVYDVGGKRIYQIIKK